MERKICAGLCILASLITYFIFNQPGPTCLFLSSTLYLFFIPFTSPKPKKSLQSDNSTNTEALEVIPEKSQDECLQESIRTLTEFFKNCESQASREKVLEILKVLIQPSFSDVDTSIQYEITDRACSAGSESDSPPVVFSEIGLGTDLLMSEIPTSGVVLTEFRFSTALPSLISKRPVGSQAQVKQVDKETEAKTITKDHETQFWTIQEDQEVNTTQTLLLNVSDEKGTKPRSNSVDFVRDEFNQEKELLIGELVCEKITNRKGSLAFNFLTHIEADFHETPDIFNPNGPCFIGLINFADQISGEINFEFLKEHFLHEKFVKVRSSEFKTVDLATCVDDPDFQMLFSAVFLLNLSDVVLIVLDGENISNVLSLFLSYKFRFFQENKPIFFLHYAENLETATQEFTINLIKKLEIGMNLHAESLGYSDNSLQIYHLEARKHQSFEFIEEKILGLKTGVFKGEFDFSQFFSEKLEMALSYIFPEKDLDRNSKCTAEDYGYCVSQKYKNMIEIPKSVLFVPETQNFIRVFPVSITASAVESAIYASPEIFSFKTKPLSALFLSLSAINFEDVLGPFKSLGNFIEIYPNEADHSNIFNDSIYNKLSSWVIGTYLADFIILLIDFNEMPDLHHNEVLLKYLLVMRDIDKPLFILHKTGPVVNYEYSFNRIIELLESAWARDRVLLHEEITEDLIENSQKLEQIKDQMNDNLFDPDTHFDISELLKLAFENTLEKLVLIQNSRKRELLIKGEVSIKEEGKIICHSELESTWKAAIREQFQQSVLKNLIYVSGAQYHIDKNISSTLYSTSLFSVQDHLVKISIFSNLPSEKLSHSYISDLAYCFSKNKDDTLLIFPSSRIVTTSASNHLNTADFNTVFLHNFMQRIADCLIISLFYEGGKICVPRDAFLGLSSMLKIRSQNKPILVFYQYQGLGEIAEYSVFFKKAVKEFDEMIAAWTGTPPLAEFKSHENQNEGIYAFDRQKQIIHRLLVPGSDVIWKWYNGVLYKIMHNSAINNQIKPLKKAAQEAFQDTLKENVKAVDDEETVKLEVLCADVLEQSWKALSSFYLTVYADILPSWLINRI